MLRHFNPDLFEIFSVRVKAGCFGEMILFATQPVQEPEFCVGIFHELNKCTCMCLSETDTVRVKNRIENLPIFPDDVGNFVNILKAFFFFHD